MFKFLERFFNDPTPIEDELNAQVIMKTSLLYGEFLGLNKDFSFVLPKKKVEDDGEWIELVKKAHTNLIEDFKRLGRSPEVVSPSNFKLALAIPTNLFFMKLLSDKDGNVSVYFFKRHGDTMLWNNGQKDYPDYPGARIDDFLLIF